MMLQNKYGITIKSQSYEKLKTYGGQGFNYENNLEQTTIIVLELLKPFLNCYNWVVWQS